MIWITQAVADIDRDTLEKVYRNQENRLCFHLREELIISNTFYLNITTSTACNTPNGSLKNLKTFKIIASDFLQCFIKTLYITR